MVLLVTFCIQVSGFQFFFFSVCDLPFLSVWIITYYELLFWVSFCGPLRISLATSKNA